ncbi:OmpA family protein [Devosia sp.]|uniref:OmpA family protein n=1 Tax=Devosia sp. TaxID=1871048 RepID=UPI003A93105E
MSGIFLRWGIPALVTVVGGTAAAITTSGAAIPTDLATRAAPILENPRFAWAEVQFGLGDAIVFGTATSQDDIDALTGQLADLRGVREVVPQIILAEFVSPFPFAASTSDGQVTLTGGYPDQQAHAALLELAGPGAIDRLQPMSGAPDRAAWQRATAFALETARKLDAGEVALNDLALSVTGRANDTESYEALTRVAQAAPADVEVTPGTITPPLADPFKWTASYDGDRLTLSGATPDDALADRLAFGAAPIPVTSDLELASGAPDGFDDLAEALLQNLLKLERGTAKISGDTSSLEGAPESADVRDAVLASLEAFSTEITLEPARVASFTLDATKTAADGLVFTGFVPDAEGRAALAALPDADVSALELARGAPDGFKPALDLGLEKLAEMSEGTLSIDGDTLSISGRATTSADFISLSEALRPEAQQDVALGTIALSPPLVETYRFRADKSADGTITLSGFAPDDATRARIAAAAGTDAAGLDFADGAPEGFEAEALAGLSALAELDRGTVQYDGAAWSVTGAIDALELPEQVAALEADGWSLKVTQPKLPIIDPYVWRARKAADGTISLTGFLPTEALKDKLAADGGDALNDSTSLGAGAPDGFAAAARAGFAALQRMEDGSLGFAGGAWTLSGSVDTAESRYALEEALIPVIDPADWRIALQVEGAAPVVAPFTWSASRAADGAVTMAGYVPSENLRDRLSGLAGATVSDSTLIGSGEPRGFADAAAAALEALSHLDTGTVAYDGEGWSISGQPKSEADADAVETALAEAPDAEWQMNLAAVPQSLPQQVEDAVAEVLDEPAAEVAVDEPSDTDTTDTASDDSEPGATETEPEMPAETAEAPEPEADPAPAEADAMTVETESPVEAPAEDLEQPVDTADVPPEAIAPEETDDAAQAAEPVDEPVPETSAPDTTPEAAETAEPAAPAEQEVAALPEAPAFETDRDYVFEANKSLGGPIAFAGEVPAEPMRRHLAVITGTEPNEELAVSETLPDNFVLSADAGSRTLKLLSDGQFGLDGTQWVLSGRVETEAERSAALAELSKLPSSAEWLTRVTVMPPEDICRARLVSFASRNAILFTSGSANITAESGAALDELSDYLQLCPEAAVDVEGHTDADGDDDANLALSVARAEAVVNALIERGVSPRRLYAVGYGESLPIASNDTAAGKRANRRIAFSLVDER